MPARIALLTDFGSAGPYTGQLRLLLQGLVPATPVIDLMADPPPFRPDLAAYLLPRLLQGMPEDTLYLCVVDPGVGSDRKALMMQAGGNWFVGPDNGLLALVARGAADVRCWRVEWRPPRLSESFHGRDLFAPLAARIISGETVAASAIAVNEMVGADWAENSPRIIYRDVYGNLCTGLDAARLGRDRLLVAGGRKLPFARTFSDVRSGEAFWYQNAFGLVELAVNCGRADQVLGLEPGDEVLLQ